MKWEDFIKPEKLKRDRRLLEVIPDSHYVSLYSGRSEESRIVVQWINEKRKEHQSSAAAILIAAVRYVMSLEGR